jgi:hypothetical protein
MHLLDRFIKIFLLITLIAALAGMYWIVSENNRLIKALDGQAYETGYSDGYKTGKAAGYKPISPETDN